MGGHSRARGRLRLTCQHGSFARSASDPSSLGLFQCRLYLRSAPLRLLARVSPTLVSEAAHMSARRAQAGCSPRLRWSRSSTLLAFPSYDKTRGILPCNIFRVKRDGNANPTRRRLPPPSACSVSYSLGCNGDANEQHAVSHILRVATSSRFSSQFSEILRPSHVRPNHGDGRAPGTRFA